MWCIGYIIFQFFEFGHVWLAFRLSNKTCVICRAVFLYHKLVGHRIWTVELSTMRGIGDLGKLACICALLTVGHASSANGPALSQSLDVADQKLDQLTIRMARLARKLDCILKDQANADVYAKYLERKLDQKRGKLMSIITVIWLIFWRNLAEDLRKGHHCWVYLWKVKCHLLVCLVPVL